MTSLKLTCETCGSHNSDPARSLLAAKARVRRGVVTVSRNHHRMLLRAANDRLVRVLADDHPGFLCECGDRDCARMIDISLTDFQRFRYHPSRFLMASDHQANEGEQAIAAGEGWIVTEVDDLPDVAFLPNPEGIRKSA